MINFEALFKVSYGLYIVSSGDNFKGNGFISNTVSQVTAKPARFAACCNKNNYTSQVIQKTGVFSVSVLHKDTSPDIFNRFGYKSGKEFNKMEGMQVRYGETGVPIVLDDAIAFLECRVIQTFDVGTHWIFIGELVQSEILDDTREPLTYMYYRHVKKGVVPRNAPTYIDRSKLENKATGTDLKKYKCTDCGYIYDEAKEGKKFSDLPENWVCPVCGAPKKDFVEI
ncbi:MAG: flavin reductase [Bacteroidales bacterium]|nr:flavin reductase [Bacteroidales bacterium]